MPRINDYDHALSIDKHDSNNEWVDSIKLEISQQHDHETYKDRTEPHSYPLRLRFEA